MEALWGAMTFFQDYLYNDPTEGFLQPNPQAAMLFSPWVYIPTHLPLGQTSQIVWHIHARAFKAARLVMQTLEVWTDTKSCRDISRLVISIWGQDHQYKCHYKLCGYTATPGLGLQTGRVSFVILPEEGWLGTCRNQWFFCKYNQIQMSI